MVALNPNNLPIIDTRFALHAEKTMTFAGATPNDPGDSGGTGTPATLFTVTGTVIMRLMAVCTTTLTGAAGTVEVGIVGNTAAFLAQIVGTTLVAGEIWNDATPTSAIGVPADFPEYIIGNGQDIVQTVATADITAGVIKYLCFWYPLSADGNVVAA